MQLLNITEDAVVDALMIGIEDGDGEKGRVLIVDLKVKVVFGEGLFSYALDGKEELLVGCLVVDQHLPIGLTCPFRLKT